MTAAAAWLLLLPYTEDADLPMLLGEHGAGALLERGVDLREIAKPEHGPAVAVIEEKAHGHA